MFQQLNRWKSNYAQHLKDFEFSSVVVGIPHDDCTCIFRKGFGGRFHHFPSYRCFCHFRALSSSTSKEDPSSSRRLCGCCVLGKHLLLVLNVIYITLTSKQQILALSMGISYIAGVYLGGVGHTFEELNLQEVTINTKVRHSMSPL